MCENLHLESLRCAGNLRVMEQLQIEVRRLNEKLRTAEAELADKRDEIGELAEELQAFEQERTAGRSGRGGRVSLSTTSGAASAQRARIEELEAEVRELRVRRREMQTEMASKDEKLELRGQQIEKLRHEQALERDAQRDLKEEISVMRAKVQELRGQLDSNTEVVQARDARSRESNKQLRQRTREFNQLMDENGRLALVLKERDEELATLATAMEALTQEKRESDARSDENMRLVNSLEKQVSVAEATEKALTKKIEELQAEIEEVRCPRNSLFRDLANV